MTMQKLILQTILLFSFYNLNAQTVEFSGGLNKNSYFDFVKNNGHSISSYTPGNGYSLGLSISDFRIDTVRMRITIMLDNYNGKIYTTNGSLAGGSETKAEVTKTTLGMGLYPVNLSAKKSFHFSFGGELHYKLMHQTTGYKLGWHVTDPNKYMTIDNDSVSINKNLFFGLSARIHYDLNIYKNWFFSPQYKFYFGISDEFKNTEQAIKSMRHNFLIGFVNKF
jgi:hypothetical protein